MNLNAWRIVDRPEPDDPVTAMMGCCWDMVDYFPRLARRPRSGKCNPAPLPPMIGVSLHAVMALSALLLLVLGYTHP